MMLLTKEQIRSALPLHTLLHQAEHWTDAEGTTWRLEDMAESHRLNVLALLVRNRRSLEVREAMEWLDGPLALRGEGADYEADYLAERDPEEWFNHLPLVRRLRELCNVEEPF